MRKNLLYVALFALSITLAQAAQPENQPMRSPESMAKRQTEVLEKKLSLSAEQKQKVYDIQLSAAKSRDSLISARKNNNGDRATIFSTMKSIQATHNAKISAVLNDAQKIEYQKLLDERRDRMSNRQRGEDSNSNK